MVATRRWWGERAMVAAALGLLACGGGRAAPPLVSGASPGPVAAPAGPAPTVAWADGEFTLTGLPAIAADGGAVLLAVRVEDGGRGAPNLTLVVRDRADHVIEELVVLAAGDPDFDDGEYPAPSDAALAAADALLARTHVEHAWQPLRWHELPRYDDAGERHAPTWGDGARTVTWDEQGFRISVDGAEVAAIPAPLLEPARTRCEPTDPDCFECVNGAEVSRLALDVERRVLAVRISYDGNDLCWEPNSHEHVLAW
jgi:hypothetical protein